jgi:diazepam-binding inhibitor (GABA receptor modulating acyl-CoA-binding protein)
MSDSLSTRFQAAVEKVRTAPADGAFKPDTEYKLKMYALFRQATDGDVSGKRPGMLDVVGRFKYDAWARLKGTSRTDAMQRYLDEVESVERRYG